MEKLSNNFQISHFSSPALQLWYSFDRAENKAARSHAINRCILFRAALRRQVGSKSAPSSGPVAVNTLCTPLYTNVHSNPGRKGQPLCLLSASGAGKSRMTNIELRWQCLFYKEQWTKFYLDYTYHPIQRQICGGPELKRLRNISLKHDLFDCEWRKWL